MKKTILVLMCVVSFNALAGEPVDSRKMLINDTVNELTVSYIECIYFEKKSVCSDEKEIKMGVGALQYFNDPTYPTAGYMVIKIKSGLSTRTFATVAELTNNPERAYIPKCYIQEGTQVITQHGSEYFCEDGGM